jgi:hypothetical protein
MSPQIKASVLTDSEKLRLERERDSTELNGSGGGLGLGAFLEEVRDTRLAAQQRRAMVRASKANNPAQHRIDRARAEKAKKKKMKKLRH